jgi:hypothetical protein
MLASGLTSLALLCVCGAPAAHAQLLDDTTHAAKISSSATAFVPGVGFVKEGGKETVPVVLRSSGADPDTGGFRYAINVLSSPAVPGPCVETPIGTLSTYTAENEGLVTIVRPGFPEPGQTLRGHLFVNVKNTPGKAGLKSVAGWTEVHDGVLPDPDGISKKADMKMREKAPEKLVDCAVP